MDNFQVDMNEYLPLRDVVFQTLRNAILKGELKPGEFDGDSAGTEAGSQQNPGS